MPPSAVARGRGLLAALLAFVLTAIGVAAATPAAAATTGTVTGASISWGVRASFVNYVTGPIAHGSIETDGVDESGGVFHWSGGSGVVDVDAGTASAGATGSVRFSGHDGQLDLTVADLRVEIDADGAFLVADMTSKELGAQEAEFTPGVALAALDTAAITVGADEVSASGASTTLTAEGAAAFAGFYGAGESLDPVTFTLPYTLDQPTEEPTEEPTEDPTEDPTEEPTEEPTEDPTDPAEPTEPSEPTDPVDPSDEDLALEVSDGTLSWGIKESFLSYIQGPIADGSVRTTGGVTRDGSVFSWTGGTGVADDEAQTALVSYPGEIRFTGHGGLLDLTISDVRLRLDGPGEGTIVATLASKALGSGEFETYVGVDLAALTFDPDALTLDPVTAQLSAGATGGLRLDDAASELTTDGAEAFAGFYEAGSALDPVSATGSLAAASEPTEVPEPTVPSVPTVPSEPTEPTGPAAGGGPGGDQAPGDDPVGGGRTAGQDEVEEQVCVANAVSGASLTWGLKSSFRSYISGGIANGGWDVSGPISDVSGGWHWSGGSGSINTETLTGTVSFGGSLHFTGHDGVLDMTVSNLVLRVTGPTSATLHADVTSNDMEGNTDSYPGIAFASLTFPAASASGGSVDVSGASATLTTAGAEGFAGFYEVGTALDTLSFELPVGGAVECSAASGTLAETGVDPAAVIAVAGAMLLLGSVLLVGRREARR
ncbi:HtaA domain-containing protein [Ruania suaedae]|uniref:HtaA domain-containing protein n=1 Tax=Ruania suaedae TaxID=2897774 RepID=UPI001E4B5961|nr:HtaA domain-containing protein [Ruania suaedae]UFU03264.1 HtaA domain-containing protein [Ruania suaedae]